jgi:hypothetical protein
VGFGVQQASDLDAAGHAGPAEIVPHQVDDHHVLGPVLGRLLKLAALSCGPAPGGRPAAGSLDGPGQYRPPGPAQEKLGRQAGQISTWQAQERCVGRLQLRCGAAEQVERVAAEYSFQPQADICRMYSTVRPTAALCSLAEGTSSKSPQA